MKMIKIKYIGLFTVLATFSIGSCSDDFLAEKKDYAGVNEEVFQEPLMAQAYVDYVYGLFLPADNNSAMTWDIAVGGDALTRTSDELPGETNWNKVWPIISANQAHCLQYLGARVSTSVANNTWTRIRQINIFLNEVDKHGMPEDVRNNLKGQLYFWRAWQYFDMVKYYGGVPLVLTAQNPILDENSDVQTPRSSTSECIEQIVADLDKAKLLLPGKWTNSADWGRITSGAAAAFKGRILLTWASPIFNPSDDTQRWQRAYDANTEAKKILEDNGFGLYATGGVADGKAWGAMWASEVNNPEAVIVYGFNNSSATNVQRNNGWERANRSKQLGGSGAVSPTRQIVDAFPMKDGQSITNSSSTYPYSMAKFFKNRDPRFYKTFVYNGALWSYAENTTFKQWTYAWTRTGTAGAIPNSFTETAGANSTGIYLNKATMSNAASLDNFQYSGTDYMEMRFAEVVLNLAESAIGVNKLAEGKALIQSIRQRAGILIGDGNYGLANVSSRDQHFAAALNERKIEFAYENKRFHDLRRWMLFDNSAGTTARLGVTPINGARRTGYFIVAKNTAGTKYVGTPDPFLPNAAGVAPIINRDPVFPYTIPSTGKNPGTVIANYDTYMDYLYDNYFEITERDNADPTTAGWKFTWYKEYYSFGIWQSLHDTAPYLKQTKGWGGDFDPLQ